MRAVLACLFATLASAAIGQDGVVGPLVDELNKQLNQTPQQPAATASTLTKLPEWGVAVKNQQGRILDLFGAVPYDVTASGEVIVPGFDAPSGAKLEVVPSREWAALAASGSSLDQMLAPIEDLPSVVLQATDYLAEQLCNNRGRPSSITLTLVVGASGNILFAEASTEAGSEVTWDLANDTCERYSGATSSP